jgi:restriction system protein
MAKADDIPDRAQIRLPLLRAIFENGGQILPSEAVALLADEFQLSDEQRQRLRPGRTNNWFHNEVAFARLKCVQEGLISRKPYGLWVITETGKAELREQGLIK